MFANHEKFPEVTEASLANKLIKIPFVYLNLFYHTQSWIAKFCSKPTYIHISVCICI